MDGSSKSYTHLVSSQVADGKGGSRRYHPIFCMTRVGKLVAFLFFWLAALNLSAQQAAAPPLEIINTELPACAVDLPCDVGIQARYGTAPYSWRIVSGSLAPGLQLDSSTGRIEGTPTEAKAWAAEIEVADSSQPPQKASRRLTSKTVAALTLEWVRPPLLEGTRLAGTLKVANNSKESIDLTVIVVAVNEIGKAFALGYQQVTLAPDKALNDVPFSSQLPAGQYTVRADAIAEIAAHHKVFRAARQAGPFAVPVQ